MNIGTISGRACSERDPRFGAARKFWFGWWATPRPFAKRLPRPWASRAELKEVLCIPAMNFERVDGFATTVVSYTTDVPMFGGAWGQPLLLGPGSIHVAHTSEERIAKKRPVAGGRALCADAGAHSLQAAA